MNPYIDEEDLLGFHVFVAELELLTGGRREAKYDEVAFLELLQKVLLSLDHTPVQVIKEYQRRCEQTLISLIRSGRCPEVQSLISTCLSKFYSVGDRLPLFSQVNDLQGILLSKDAFGKKLSDNAKVGMLNCLTVLCRDHGSHLLSSLPSLISTAMKHATRSATNNRIRFTASNLISTSLYALSNDSRHATTSQAEALKLAERYIKSMKVDELKVVSLEIIRSVAQAGGAALWIQGGSPYEEIFKLVLSNLYDSSHSVRRACGETLGELIAVLKSTALQEAIEKEPKENKKQSLQKLSARTFQDALGTVFYEAASNNKKAACVVIARSWVSYLAALSVHTSPDENALVALAIEFISSIARLSSPPETKSRDTPIPVVELGYGLATGEFPMAQACVLYALRTGVFRYLTESGQRKLVDQLGTLLSSLLGNCVPVVVCSLESVRVLLSILGEVSPETASDLGITFMEKLVSNSASIRSQAAAALGVLVEVDPACAATLITSCIEFLKNQIEQLASLSARFGAMHPIPGNLITSNPDAFALPEDAVKRNHDACIREAMYAVYGYSAGLASLLVAASRTTLSVPSSVYNEAFHFAQKLILNAQSTVANAWAIEMKAGYCILGAICAAMPIQTLKTKGDLLELFQPALGTTAQALMLNKGLMKAGKENDVALQLWWRSEALQTLEVYIRAVVNHAAFHKPKHELQRIVTLLAPLLEGLTSTITLEDPNQAVGGPGGWIAGTLGNLQLRLLNIFLLFPDTNAFSKEQSLLIKLCSQPFSSSSSLLNSPVTAASIGTMTLRSILNTGDHHLGPWEIEEEPLEEKLNQMTGEKGAPHYTGWECGMPVWGIAGLCDAEGPKIDFEPQPFPQYTSLTVALVQAQVMLFGKLLESAATKNKLQFLDSLMSCTQSVKSLRNLALQQALMSSICYAVLFGFRKSRHKASSEVVKKMMELAMAMIESCGDQRAVIRGTAEVLAVAAQMGDDAFALRLTKQLCLDLSSTTSSDRQCFLLLSIGCLFRSKGGMCLQTVLPNVVSLLVSFAKKFSGKVLLWTLHSLHLIALSAGLPFMPYVRTTLELSQQLMTKQDDLPSIRPFLGRLTNAMVAVLGPELAGSKNYNMCKCLMRQMTSLTAALSTENIAGALEVVLYAQQLILFAPQAAPAKKHVSILMDALNLPHPSLRHQAAITLRHLTERDPQTICKEGLEKPLFKALDEESEAHISKALILTLEALQFAQCPTRCSVWLEVCASIVLTYSREATPRERTLHKEGSLMREELEELDVSAIPSSSPTSGGRTPRLKTRLFACHCLLKIFEAVGKDPSHFDLVQAKQSSSSQEYLVCQLQEIVKLGFSLSTGQVEALQPEGIKLLNAVILHFGEADDPDIEDTKLLFQFQAQFVSPLRQALAPVAPPLLFMSGSILAVSFLRSGLGGSDAAVLKQLVGLLVEPIQNWSQLRYRNFSEWVSACVRVSLLEAHAHCTILAKTGNDQLCAEIVEKAQEPILEQLKHLWLGLLTDHMVLDRWSNELWSAYQPLVICTGQNGSEVAKKVPADEAWPVVLKALALHIPSANAILESDKDASAFKPLRGSPQELNLSEDHLLSSSEMYQRLLDVTIVRLGTSSMTVIEQAKSEDDVQITDLDIDPICICLDVLKTLLSPDYMALELCSVEICLEGIEMILSIIQQVFPQFCAFERLLKVIHPIVCSLNGEQHRVQQKLFSVVESAAELLHGVSMGLTDAILEQSNFVSTLLDCILACSSILMPSPSHASNTNNAQICCFETATKVVSSARWDDVKEWLSLFSQHGLLVLGCPQISKDTIAAVSTLFRISVQFLMEKEEEELTNGNETMSTMDLAAWIACSFLDLVQKQSNALRSASEISENAQKRLSQFTSAVLALVEEVSLKQASFFDASLNDTVEFLNSVLKIGEKQELQLGVLQAIKYHLQENASKTNASLTALFVSDLGPLVSTLAHETMVQESSSSIDVLLIAECLKYLTLILGLPEVSGKEEAIFAVLIPLLIESMEYSASSIPAQMAFKLVSHLNVGKHAASFKASIGTLSMDLKQRFQKGIQKSIGQDIKIQGSTSTASSTEQKPSIILKNFSVK